MYGEEIVIGGNSAEAEILVASLNVQAQIAGEQEARRLEMRQLQVANMTGGLIIGKLRRPGFVQD